MKKLHSSPQLDRRDFVKSVTLLLGTAMGALLGLPAIEYLIAPALDIKETEAWIPVGRLSNYKLGQPRPFNFTRTQVNGWEKTVTSYGTFIVRRQNGEVMVLSNICTHLGCHVSWHPDLQHYVSPCHNGHFDLYGQVVSGPPPRPLDEFKTKIEAGMLYIYFPPIKRRQA